MKLTMLGWYGKRNIGDEAFKTAHALMFAGHELTHVVEQVPEDSDCIILGGGDVVMPFYLKAIPAGRPFYVLGAGLGYESEVDHLANQPVKEAVLRNRADVRLAVSRGLCATYAPDITFMIDMPKLATRKTPRQGRRKRAAVILSDHISPSPWHRDPRRLSYYDYMKWELALSMDALADYYDFHWIPFSADVNANDQRIHLDTFGRVERRRGAHRVHEYPGGPEAAIALLGDMDLVISMKYHGVLFATNLGVPFVNIGLSRKTQVFCEEQGLGDMGVAPFSLEKDRLLQVVKNAERGGVREQLLEVAARNRSELQALTERLHAEWLA